MIREEYKRVLAEIAERYASGTIRAVLVITTDKNGKVRAGWQIDSDDKYPMLTRLRSALRRCIKMWNAEGSRPKIDEIP